MNSRGQEAKSRGEEKGKEAGEFTVLLAAESASKSSLSKQTRAQWRDIECHFCSRVSSFALPAGRCRGHPAAGEPTFVRGRSIGQPAGHRSIAWNLDARKFGA